MSIDIQHETLRTFQEAAALLPGPPHISTLVRWARKGMQGVYLDYVRVGRRLVTSSEAVERFVHALADADHREQRSRLIPPASSKQRARREAEIRAAEEYCRSRGI